MCDRLINAAGLTSSRGWLFYTDIWYISMDLAKNMWVKHKCKICGTISQTNKKSHQDHDIPFLKLSKVKLNEVKHGWFCEAVVAMKTPTGKTYYIQCIMINIRWCYN